MDRGTYSAASGGLVQLRKLEIVNNNLANINTPGFKRQILLTEKQSFESTFAKELESTDPFARGDHDRTPGSTNLQSVVDFSPGPIKNTGNALDVALHQPNDFFVVQTPEGPQYTRAGNFSINAKGELTSMDGMPVLGDGGGITISGPGALINPDGSVNVDGTPVGKLRVVRFEDTSSLMPVGNSRFKTGEGAAAPPNVEAEVIPQSLEMANLSVVSTVVDLMSTNRAFDLYTRMATSIDQVNQSAISQVGRRNS